jgi:hypothetical protein
MCFPDQDASYLNAVFSLFLAFKPNITHNIPLWMTTAAVPTYQGVFINPEPYDEGG